MAAVGVPGRSLSRPGLAVPGLSRGLDTVAMPEHQRPYRLRLSVVAAAVLRET
jgi:hypothetical protein